MSRSRVLSGSPGDTEGQSRAGRGLGKGLSNVPEHRSDKIHPPNVHITCLMLGPWGEKGPLWLSGAKGLDDCGRGMPDQCRQRLEGPEAHPGLEEQGVISWERGKALSHTPAIHSRKMPEASLFT